MVFFDLVKTKKHILWDWNGTILNDVDHAVRTINQMLEPRDLPRVSKESYRNLFGFPIRSYYESLGFDLVNENFEELCHQFVEKYLHGLGSCTPFASVRDRIEKMHTLGLKQSVLSAADQESLDHMVSHFGFSSYFEKVFGIHDKMGASKVDRGNELISSLGLSADEIILVGDTLHDLEVGKSLGCEVILVGQGHQCIKRLQKGHELCLESI